MARILFADETAGNDLVATGVEFIHNSNTYVVHAKKEVILSAGYVLARKFSLLCSSLTPQQHNSNSTNP